MFKQKYWLVIAIYILMQALTAIIPLTLHKFFQFDYFNVAIYNTIFLFIIAALATIWIMWKELKEEQLNHPLGAGKIIGWSFLGLVLAYIAEIVAASILLYGFNVEPNSANTEGIVEIARSNVLFIVIPAIFGPILEEFIFRKIIFGYINKKTNFIIAAVISSLLFGLAHMEMSLLLVYFAMGFVFASIYALTKRIIIPIIVHMSLNSVAVIAQLLIDPEKLRQLQEQMEQMQEQINLIISIF